MAAPSTDNAAPEAITVGPLQENELEAADRIFRLAFGTFIGLPDPMTYAAGTNSVGTRWKADPQAALAARAGERLVGSNLISVWGSFGLFGPLTVHPELWNAGVATRLLARTMDLFERRGVRHAGLFTDPQSPLHIHLYEKFDFWAQFLTAIMAKEVVPATTAVPYALWSELAEDTRQESFRRCREVTETVLEGLDLAPEIRSVAAQRLGDTLLLKGDTRLDGFAVCHCGPGTEAGLGTCYVKFGAVRCGAGAAERFERLLGACEAFAERRGLGRLVAGTNVGRLEAYRTMRRRGFRSFVQGVAMTRHAETVYNHAEAFVIDDWR
jgi:GNAT superfamily N-acetyltransferase